MSTNNTVWQVQRWEKFLNRWLPVSEHEEQRTGREELKRIEQARAVERFRLVQKAKQ